MEVRFGTGLGISFFPGLFVALEDRHLRSRGADIVFIKQAKFGIDLLPLFQKQLRIGSIVLNHARITLERNRAGAIDFVSQRFNEVTVALIDAQGCATARQKIHGTFQKPEVEKPSILTSLSGPAVKLLKKGRDLFPGRKCVVFYAGSVAPPK